LRNNYRTYVKRLKTTNDGLHSFTDDLP